MGVGTGPIAPPEVARVTMLLRANCPVQGQLGRPRRADRARARTAQPRRHPVHPRARLVRRERRPRAPLLRGAGAGRRRSRAVRRRDRDAAGVLAELGLEPFLLEAKEGLALTNGTSFMSAFACLAVGAARELADLADLHDRDGLRGAARQPRPLQRVPVRPGQAPPGDGHERAPHPRAAGRLAAGRRQRRAVRRAGWTAPASSSSTARSRTSTRSAARRTSTASLRDVLDWVEEWIGDRDQLLRRQPAVQRGRRARRERRQLLRRPHRPGHGLAEGRAGQPVRPDRPPARARRRREVQPRPDRRT